MLPIVEEVRGYDFMDPQNADKWRGLFIIPLKKVLEQVHPTLGAEDSALEYVESLCLRLLAMLCAAPPPTTVLDVEERVSRVFPSPLARWALSDARDASCSRRRRPLLLPADRIHAHLHKAKVTILTVFTSEEVLPPKTDVAVSTFMTSIVEYVSADVLKLAGNFKKIAQNSFYETITCTDIKTAMCADKVLMDMFHAESELAGVAGAGAALGAGGGGAGAGARRQSLTYAELVRDLLADLHHFLKELNLIIRVFKDDIEKIVADVDDKLCPQIFGNIVDIYELTVTLLGNVEDAIEMAEDSPTPFIGSCFEELAEVEEFRAYVRYANTVTSPDCRDAINTIADDPELGERLEAANQGFRLAVKLYLPRLLLAPVSHVFAYHSYVLSLMHVSSATDDREHFKQVDCNLSPIKKLLIKAVGNQTKIEPSYRAAARARRQLAIDKCSELAKLVDSWEQREIAQCCNEFYREDVFIKLGPGRRTAERRVYMFDGVLVLCKPVMPIVSLVMAHPNSTNSASGTQLKLKERLHMRKMVIYDRPDTEEARNIVELVPVGGAPVLLSCASRADKLHWLSDAVMLNTRPTLERCLDSLLLELERRHPLQLPPTSLYRFAEPDGPHNLVLDHTNPAPLIKGATLLKLVERLTYHIYADLNLVRTFLTTYRSFCSPHELLDLLVERFNIPEPSEVYDTPRPGESIDNVASDADKLSMNTVREDWKRYRKEFQQPVKFRVINVIRHWVDGHFYDFERDEELLEKLRSFLNSVDGKPMRKWVKSVLKTIQRKSGQMGETESVSHVFSTQPPAPLRHPADPARHRWHPLALHPLELARQLTLLEFQLYRLVRPSELVGAVWTKRDKERSSPNLLTLIKHTTNFTRWMEKWIVESENIEERAGVVCRLLELAGALRDLNNFNGVLAVVAAAGSAAVHRLRATFQLVPPRLLRALEEFRELNSDHFRRYQERLRSINPPCVPFFGMYLTNILHIEEGNLDYLPNSELINFSKRRKVAEITGEIQQYQNQPYCLTVEPKTRAFLESLDPFPGMDDNEITNYLYAKSLEIEPRAPAKQIPKFPRKYPELSLKPMKISRRHHDQPAPDDINCNQLSPTSAWDGGSVSSLSIDEKTERVPLSSPRSERASLAQLSLLDKGLALFDKTKSGTLSSLSSHGSTASMVSTAGTTNTGIGTCGTGPGTNNTKPALSPRGAIVDAELFYSRNTSHRREQSQERVPPLLPRNSAVSASTMSVNSTQMNSDEEPPPVLPRRPSSPHHPPDIPPEPPERPLPSPKHLDFYRMSGMSPKRSPAPQPPVSPLTAHDSRVNLFRFPAAGSPSPPAHPHPPPPLTPYSASTASSSSTPPPLPPRRRRDSAALPAHSPAAVSCVSGPSGASGPSGPPPPPLPPRPAPAPPLLRPAHSTILQRRHHTHNSSTGAPRLPPKPPPAAVAPRT